ncbi:MAG TPA: hypothetical protein VN514_01105 [Ignavibacteria bacterium]|nr:hypothetical protein [Ignavibacteria bacterium]
MFEQITEKRINDASKEVNRMRDFTYESVINSGLNEFTKNFILSESGNFGSREAVLKAAEKAVKLLINYTLRPKWTIVNFIFGSLDSKPSSEILKKVEVFTFYHYYLELIRSIALDSEQISVKKITVDAALESVNKDIYEKLTTDISSLKIKNLFVQVFRLKYGDNSEISLDMSVPYYFIKLYLEDKGYDDLLSRFGSDFSDGVEIELKTIIKVLTGKYTVYDTSKRSDESFTQVPSSFTVKKTEDAPITEMTKPEKETPAAEESQNAAEKSLGNQFEEKQEISEIQEDSIIEETPPPAAIIPESEERHIRYLFKEEEIKNISKKIFKGRKHLMFDSLLEIEKLHNWRETTEYLKKLFIENKVDYYDKNVILFTDILSDYFEKRER